MVTRRRTLDAVRSFDEPWELGGVRIPNRFVLAPLAGIGNWFVRLQAKRHGAGLAVSEMVSSFAIHYGNRRTLDELLVIHPASATAGPSRSSCSGTTRTTMRSAAEQVAARRRRPARHQHGLPRAQGVQDRRGRGDDADPERAVAVARAAIEGSGLPVTVKLRAEAAERRPPAGRGGRRRGDHLPPAHRRGAPPRPAGLRPRRPARGRAPRAGDRLRRDAATPSTCAGRSSTPARRRSCSRAARSATRGCSSRCSACATALRRATRCWRSGAGCSIAPRSTSGPTARCATCASSIPGIWTASGRAPGPGRDAARGDAPRPARAGREPARACGGVAAETGASPRLRSLPSVLPCATAPHA